MAWDPELLTEQAMQAMQESSRLEPTLYPWGVFSWGDAPPACGGGVGGFQWFASLNDLLAWVTDLSPASYMTFDDEGEWLAYRDDLRETGKSFSNNPQDTLNDLNVKLRGLLQIDWIGVWQDLLVSTDPYPQLIRQRFRNDWDSEDPFSTTQIPDDELEAFLDFVREYGV